MEWVWINKEEKITCPKGYIILYTSEGMGEYLFEYEEITLSRDDVYMLIPEYPKPPKQKDNTEG